MRNDDDNPSPRSGIRLRPLVLGIVAGLALAVAIGLVLLFFFARGKMPRLTEESLAAATQRWEERGPANYRLQIAVSGERAAMVTVEVRDGEPISLVRDGRSPPRHTWDFWTVPGQFEAMEMEMTGNPQTMFGVPDHADVIQRAEFDAEYGYPRKYQRQVLGKSLDVGWEVTRFEVIE